MDPGLTALLSSDPRISSGRVDKTDDRQLVLGGEPHFGHGLAVAFRMSHPVVVFGSLMQIAPTIFGSRSVSLQTPTGTIRRSP